MKKTLAVVIAIITALTFASCSKKATKQYEPGKWKGNEYKSEFLNATIKVSDGWTIATKDELAKEEQIIIEDSMASTDASREEIERGIICELKLTNDKTFAYMDIVLKDMDIIYSAAHSEEDYMEVYRQNMQNVTVEDMSISSMSDAKWVKLGGNDSYMMEVEYSYANADPVYQRIYFRKVGTYMCTLTMSVVDKAEFTAIEDMFK